MKLERKIYETRSQKVGDFFLGIGIFIAINVVLGSALSFGASILGGLIVSASNGSDAGGMVMNLLLLVAGAIPLLLELGLLIYFGLTRHWIALGMLGAFAIILLIVLLLGAACFGMVFLLSAR